MAKFPVVLAECSCHEWWMPLPGIYPWGRCGFCGEVPVFKAEIPEDQWPEV